MTTKLKALLFASALLSPIYAMDADVKPAHQVPLQDEFKSIVSEIKQEAAQRLGIYKELGLEGEDKERVALQFIMRSELSPYSQELDKLLIKMSLRRGHLTDYLNKALFEGETASVLLAEEDEKFYNISIKKLCKYQFGAFSFMDNSITRINSATGDFVIKREKALEYFYEKYINIFPSQIYQVFSSHKFNQKIRDRINGDLTASVRRALLELAKVLENPKLIETYCEFENFLFILGEPQSILGMSNSDLVATHLKLQNSGLKGVNIAPVSDEALQLDCLEQRQLVIKFRESRRAKAVRPAIVKEVAQGTAQVVDIKPQGDSDKG